MGHIIICRLAQIACMANPSISVPDDLLEDFDDILKAKAARGELESDRRSPVIQEWMQEFVDENQDDLERWRAFAEGNPSRGVAAVSSLD